jgi:hypothetical protein
MKLRLNYWQLILLFVPFIVAFLSAIIPYKTRIAYHLNSEIIAIMIIASISLAICYQAYLLISFNKRIKGSIFISFNAAISAVFMTICTLFTIKSVILMIVRKTVVTKIVQTERHWLLTCISLFLTHAFITFFLVNNIYLSGKIKKINDFAMRENLRDDFGEPMKKVLITSLLIIAGSFVIVIAYKAVSFNLSFSSK